MYTYYRSEIIIYTCNRELWSILFSFKRTGVVKQAVQLMLLLLATSERWRGGGGLLQQAGGATGILTRMMHSEGAGQKWFSPPSPTDKRETAHTIPIPGCSSTPQKGFSSFKHRYFSFGRERCAQYILKRHKQGVSQIFFCHP